ncbi:RNA polymerase sigma factor [Kribbella monticola]|uniref:RNA polymerase sigma factor n=1 Tax=Kribbella monticola TaxID=2185285 RepID=UPI000DD31349|nr:sigma-70 family RNA polymerase sigma factor [Kribbella monticola]
MTDDPAVAEAVALAHRKEWAFVLAATARVTRDLDLAEECVQDAYAKALTVWSATGIPARPGAWLTTTARNRAIDLIRREASFRAALPLLADEEVANGPSDSEDIADERLRLIFTCCHPALAPEAQVALTLRLVCGLTTAEIARAFLVSESTMAARITRAKKKIAVARIPYRIPDAVDLTERIGTVLTVVDLLFTTGHVAPNGPDLMNTELISRALDLGRMLTELLPTDPEVTALLALMLLTDARRAARLDTTGRPVLLADQDRGRWDQAAIREGQALVRRALRRGPAGQFAVRAAIAAVHSESPSWETTDWSEIVGLYDVLLARQPSPVAALNRAVAKGFAAGPEAGLAALEELATEPQLATYPYAAVARGEFLRRLGRDREARSAYEEALTFTENAAERATLRQRLAELSEERG